MCFDEPPFRSYGCLNLLLSRLARSYVQALVVCQCMLLTCQARNQSLHRLALVSQPTGLATQSLFTQPPLTTGLGLPEVQPTASLGPQASSPLPPVAIEKISTHAYIKAASTVGLSSSPEITTKSGDTVSVLKTIPSVSVCDSVAPAAASTVSAVPTVPQGNFCDFIFGHSRSVPCKNADTARPIYSVPGRLLESISEYSRHESS